MSGRQAERVGAKRHIFVQAVAHCAETILHFAYPSVLIAHRKVARLLPYATCCFAELMHVGIGSGKKVMVQVSATAAKLLEYGSLYPVAGCHQLVAHVKLIQLVEEVS